MEKKIGIVGYKSADGSSFGAGISYLDYLSKYGDVRILMPTDEFVPDLDLVFMPGGLDTSPENYGETPSFRTTNQDVFKEFFLHKRLPLYIGNTPIFGVCLGMQQLAAFFNCKLEQHVKYHVQNKERYESDHPLYCHTHIRGQQFFFPDKTERGKDPTKLATVNVNSFHHQALLGTGVNNEEIEVLAWEPNYDSADGIVGTFVHRTHKIIGHQAHCEDLSTNFDKALMNWLLED